jgi:hypothetical protein
MESLFLKIGKIIGRIKERIFGFFFFTGLTEGAEIMITEEDIDSIQGEPAEKEEWITYDSSYVDDPFMIYMSAKFKSNLRPRELALEESLLQMYMSGTVEVRMDGENEPLVRLTANGSNLVFANMMASYGHIAEA